MILHALCALYDRLQERGEAPSYGFSVEDLGFVVTLNSEGGMVAEPEDLRQKVKANAFEYRRSTVPYTNQVNVRANAAAKTPNFMVDKADYIFGMSGKAKMPVHHEHFKKRIDEVCGDAEDAGVVAVKRFLAAWNPADSTALPGWTEISGEQGKWIAFRLEGDPGFVHERPVVKRLWVSFLSRQEHPRGVSLIDGRECSLQRQYAQFKFGTGASLVSFNEPAYESYGKRRGENAPISVEAEFKSSTALKHLMRSRTQRIKIGDATTVFWTERESSVESFLGVVLNPWQTDAADAVPVREFLDATRRGELPAEWHDDVGMKFYILGLSLNKARLALRFWYVCSVETLMERLSRHFADLEMERSESDPHRPGVWRLLRETAREPKDVSPVLAGALMRSILTGGLYPRTLYQGVMARIRADHTVNYPRAAVLKAVLQRNHNKEVPMAWDPERRETAYLLGGLFAVLERAQLDALGRINATIKDRFFSAACATPASVFPRLLRLSQHHIDKADYGAVSERRIAAIMEHVDEFPSHMDLRDQGLFAIAYYHRKNAIEREISEAAGAKQQQKHGGDENE